MSATDPSLPTAPNLAADLSGERRAAIVAALAEGIREQPVDVLASGETSAMPFVAIVAAALGLPMVYLRSASKQHGRRRLLEGTVAPGARVAVVYATDPDPDLAAAHRNALAEAGAGDVVTLTLGAGEREGARSAGVWGSGRVGDPATAPGALTPALSPAGEREPHTPLHSSLFTLHSSEALTPALSPAGEREQDDQPVAPTENSELRTQNSELDPAFSFQPSRSRRIAETLLDIGAVTINTAEPYRFVSGILSPIYSDQRIVFSHPEHWNVIVESLAEEAEERIGLNRVAAIAGMVTSGIPSASVLAYSTGLPLCYVDDGQLVADLPAGSAIVIIEDHITTGGSVLKAAGVFRRAGIDPAWCLATFSYDAAPAIARFREHGIELTVLCTLQTLLEVGIGRGAVSAADAESVRDWARDPNAWTRAREE